MVLTLSSLPACSPPWFSAEEVQPRLGQLPGSLLQALLHPEELGGRGDAVQALRGAPGHHPDPRGAGLHQRYVGTAQTLQTPGAKGGAHRDPRPAGFRVGKLSQKGASRSAGLWGQGTAGTEGQEGQRDGRTEGQRDRGQQGQREPRLTAGDTKATRDRRGHQGSAALSRRPLPTSQPRPSPPPKTASSP